MAFTFGDGFDLYAANTDATLGYWDSGGSANQWTLQSGRFSGSQALRSASGNITYLAKSSGANDAVHHFNVVFRETNALSGTNPTLGLQLLDGTTAQCTVAFRADGAIELRSGSITGTVLATWSTGYNIQSAWISYEIEVVINNTTGSIAIRRNGNTSNDFSATSLNTRGGTSNNYANKLQVVSGSGVASTEYFDDILWRSDTSSVSWVGDVRCWTRMPASTASAQFAASPSPYPVTPYTAGTTLAIAAGTARYAPFTATVNGTLGTAVLSLNAGYTGNMKCSLFAASSGLPTTVIASATTITNPATGNNTFTFSSPPSLTKGTQYILGFDSDTSSGTWSTTSAANAGGLSSTTAYASFPAANPSASATQTPIITANITPTSNADLVSEAQQDSASTYVYDSTVGHGDLYAISSLSGISTVASVVAVTTRGFMEKGDAGARGAAMQLKSGATTVNSGGTLLSTSFSWLYRTDTTDPNTSSAWTAANVDSVQIGPTVTS